MTYKLVNMDEDNWQLVDNETQEIKLLPGVDVEVDAEYFVRGFQVFHTKPYDTPIIDGIDLPLYTKRRNSHTIYCAGYYCIKYDTCWKVGNVILLPTLLRNEYVGPFHTKEKALSVLAEVRNR